MRSFAPLRLSILAALGVAGLPGCDSSITDMGGGGAGAGNAGGAGSGGGEPAACVDPQPILVDGVASGFVRCADGSIDRVAQVACADPMPQGTACMGNEENMSCATDADCVDRPYGRCIHHTDEFEGGTYCGCSYGCASDTDCSDEQVCLCGGVIDSSGSAHCVGANCATGEDCGEACGLSVYDDGCGGTAMLTCRSGQDTCRSDAACAMDEDCSPGTSAVDGPPYSCKSNNECAIGRPMTIEGQAHVAPRASRADWSASPGTAGAGYEPSLRAALAERWTTIAALEHASVGSFARFTLQLLALGAPSELLSETQRAAADEVEHARLAYGLASAFAGRALGPGPLVGAGAPIPTSDSEIVRALIAEACIGETLGVAEALASAEICSDPAIRSVLERVSSDEQRHAELAWRTLAWMLAKNPALVTEVQGAVDSVQPLFEPAVDAIVDREAGLLSSREIVSIRKRAFDEVVRPCLAALIASLPAAA